MCILFAYFNSDPKPGDYKVILATNRDEIYSRPSKPAHQWSDGIYGGLDMQPGKEGGTWLTINKHGRIGILLNIAQNKEMNAVDQTSRRGFYAVDWVTDMEKDMKNIFDVVKERHGSCLQTFRLVLFDTCGRTMAGTLALGPDKYKGYEEVALEPGFHALGNNAPGVMWNKIIYGKQRFQDIVTQHVNEDKKVLVDQLIQLLQSRERHWPDPGLSDQMSGRPETVLQSLSSIYVEIPTFYGTRTHSVILVDSENKVFFYERTMSGVPVGLDVEWIENCHEFNLEPKY